MQRVRRRAAADRGGDRVAALLDAGDEDSLRDRASIEPRREDAIVALAELLVTERRATKRSRCSTRDPRVGRTRRVAALARVGSAPQDDYDDQLTALLDGVKTDDDARQEYVDLLELLGPDDPRTADYRRQLTARLF